MAQPSKAPVPSQKLLNLLKDFQQIASMSGYLNHAFDPPQLRRFFTLYGRVMVASPEDGLALTPQLQAWCDAVSTRLREGSSGTIMQPQVQVSVPQIMPDGRDYLVATVTFNDADFTKVVTGPMPFRYASNCVRFEYSALIMSTRM